MKIKTALMSIMLVGVAVPAFAQSSYYIVQDSATKHCSVVDTRPEVKTMTVVGPDGVTYKTETEAEGAMKTVTVCK